MSEVKAFFENLNVDPAKVAGMNVVYQFNITGATPSTWAVAIADGALKATEGAAEKANIELIMAEADFLALLNGSLNGQQAFLTGKLKIKGDMTLALKLQSIFNLG